MRNMFTDILQEVSKKFNSIDLQKSKKYLDTQTDRISCHKHINSHNEQVVKWRKLVMIFYLLYLLYDMKMTNNCMKTKFDIFV